MDHPNFAGKYFVSFIPTINITLILGWNSLAISNLWYFNIQLSRYLTYVVSKAMIRSVQIDILTTNFKLLSCFYHVIHWFSNIFRKKPPWLLVCNTHVAYRILKSGTYGLLERITSTRNKFLILYPFVLHDLSTFIACSLLHIIIFHTELHFCSIIMILELLIVENIDIPYHNHKRSYLFHKMCRSQGIIRSSTHLHTLVHKPPWLYSHIIMQKDVHFEILEDANLPTKTDHE